MGYTFGAPDAPERHETQYFEILCNRGIYHRGWSAVTKHRTPWAFGQRERSLDADVWELYDGRTDWTQAHDLAAAHPERLAELQRLFLIQAARFNVLPLDARFEQRLLPEVAGRPALVRGTSQTLFAGMRSLSEDTVVGLKNRSHTVTAQVVVPAGGARGVIINQGGITGGWVLYVTDNRLAYCYNFVGLAKYAVAAADPLPAGEHQVRVEFAYDGGGPGKGGTATLYVDGRPAGAVRVERTHVVNFNLDETNDVGRDTGAPVTDDYPPGDNAFTGEIKWIRFEAGGDSHDHLIDPAHLHLLAMTRQ